MGPFGIAEAHPLGDDAAALGLVGLAEVARRCFDTLTVDADTEREVRFGRPLPQLAIPGQQAALLSEAGELLALYRQVGAGSAPDTVFVLPSGPGGVPAAGGRPLRRP